MDLTDTRKRKPKEILENKVFRDGQIYLFRRADYKKPIWFCRVKVPGAKGYVSQSTKTADEHEAYKFADNLYNRSLVRVIGGQELNGKRVSTAMSEYVETLKLDLTPKFSIKLRIKFLERVAPSFGKLMLSDFTTANIMDLYDHMRSIARNGSLASNTIQRYSTDLKQFFSWCIEKGYIQTVPKFPKVKLESNRRPHFDNADYNKLTRYLREYVKHQNQNIVRDRTLLINYVLILANTGIRVGEARNLKWRDVREIEQNTGSNLPADVALVVKGKTGAREVVARTPDVKIYLKRILDMRMTELGKAPSGDDYIFCSKDGSPIGSFKGAFSTLIKNAGVEFDSHGSRRSLYSLRHTYATFRLQEGVHHFILARNMGTSTEMLEKHYGHTSNIASAAELTKGGTFNGDKKKATAIDWLLE
jgi:integrase